MISIERKGNSVFFRPDILVLTLDELLSRGFSTDGYSPYDIGCLNIPGLEDTIILHRSSNALYPPESHIGSAALYIIEKYVGNHKLLVSILPPNSLTSRHHHPYPIREHYIVIKGKVILNNEVIREGENFTLESNIIHQIRTADEPVILGIIMENARLIPDNKQHVYDNENLT